VILAALADALAARAAGPDPAGPWTTATDLARLAGASGPADAQFLADARALCADGAIRLMGDSGTVGRADSGFFEAMLVPPGEVAPTRERGW
jgi:hypothetical protein